jgi:hypothetical protein
MPDSASRREGGRAFFIAIKGLAVAAELAMLAAVL